MDAASAERHVLGTYDVRRAEKQKSFASDVLASIWHTNIPTITTNLPGLLLGARVTVLRVPLDSNERYRRILSEQ